MNEVVSYNPDLFEAIKAGMGLHELDLGNEQLASACKNLFKSEVYARGWVFRVAGDNSGDRFEFHLQNNKNDLPVISRSKEMVEAEGGFLADMRALRVSVGDLFRILVVEHDASLTPSKFAQEMEAVRERPNHKVVWSGRISPRNEGRDQKPLMRIAG